MINALVTNQYKHTNNEQSATYMDQIYTRLIQTHSNMSGLWSVWHCPLITSESIKL